MSEHKELMSWHLLTPSYNRYDAFGKHVNYVMTYSQKRNKYYLKITDKQGNQISPEYEFDTIHEAAAAANADNDEEILCTALK